MFKKMKSTFYMEQLTTIESYLKEGFQLKEGNTILSGLVKWTKMVSLSLTVCLISLLMKGFPLIP